MSRRTIAILLTALLLPLSSCGALGKDKKKDRTSSSSSGSNSGLGNGSKNQGEQAEGDNPAGGPQSFDINKTVYYAGMKLTFGKLIYDPAKEYPEAPLTIDTTVENISPTGVSGSPAFTVKLDNDFVEGSFNDDFGNVPSGETGKTTIDFKLSGRSDKKLGDLSAGILQIGGSKSVRAEAPLGANGQLVDLAAKPIFDKQVVKTTKRGKIWFNKCSLQSDLPSDHKEVERDMRTIVCYIDAQDTAGRLTGEYMDKGSWILRLPDNSVAAADVGPIEAFYQKKKISDEEIIWKIKWPESGAAGKYTIEVEFAGGTAKLPIQVPA